MPIPEPASLDDFEATLRRRHARFVRYLRVRAAIGLVLLAVGAVAAGIAVAIAGTAVGLWTWAAVTPWTTGFDALLATFLPAAFGFLTARPGWAWWRDRHPEAPDNGCLTC